MASPLPADRCTDMADVRTAIDALDRRIIALLAERMRYIEAAARIKPSREAVRDERRKADVLAKVSAAASVAGFPPALAGAVYEVLIEGSIAHELAVYDRL